MRQDLRPAVFHALLRLKVKVSLMKITMALFYICLSAIKCFIGELFMCQKISRGTNNRLIYEGENGALFKCPRFFRSIYKYIYICINSPLLDLFRRKS